MCSLGLLYFREMPARRVGGQASLMPSEDLQTPMLFPMGLYQSMTGQYIDLEQFWTFQGCRHLLVLRDRLVLVTCHTGHWQWQQQAG